MLLIQKGTRSSWINRTKYCELNLETLKTPTRCLQGLDTTLLITLDPISLSSHCISLHLLAPISFFFYIMDVRPGSFCEHKIERGKLFCAGLRTMQKPTCLRFHRLTHVQTVHRPQSTARQSADCFPSSLKPWSLLFQSPCLSLPFSMGLLGAFSGPLKFRAGLPL